MDIKQNNQLLSQSVSSLNIKIDSAIKDVNLSDKIDEKKNIEHTQINIRSSQQLTEPKESDTTNVSNVDTSLKQEQNIFSEFNFSLEDVFVNLTLIARINVGNKLVRYDKHINIDTSFFPSITRWIYGQNRSDNIKFTSTILSKAFEYSDYLSKQKDDECRQNLLRLNTSLSNAVNGLSNLSQTYYYDKLAQSEIEVMINNIRTKLNIQSKHIQFVEESKIQIKDLKDIEKENKREISDLKQAIDNVKKDKKDDRRDDRRDEKRDERRESEKREREHDDHSHSSHQPHLKKKSL